MLPLGPQLRALRIRAGLRQIDLVSAGVGGQSTISEMESDVRPTTTDVVQRYLTACGGDLRVVPADETPPDGERLLAAWRRLPESDRAMLLDMIEARANKR